MNRENNLDNFDANNQQNDDRDRNDFFKNRGGRQYSGAYSNNQGRGGYGNRQTDFRERGGDIPNFHNRNYNNYNRRPYNDNNGYRENNNYRGRGNNRGYNRYNNRGNYSDRNYSDRRYDNYNNPNFENREYQRESNYNRENEDEREMQREKEEIISNFKKKYYKIIEAFKVLFINESLKEDQIIDILQNIKSTPNLTIFEAMNSIYRQVQIIKTLSLDKFNRQYGPNSDRLEFEFDQQKSNKNIIEKVIKEYKINKLDEKEKEESTKQDSNISNNLEEKNSEKFWYYIDDFDKRRKLIKDEEGYFNYLPLMNPSGENYNKDEDDVYAKNENEISYHALFYKTKMCQECVIDNNSNKNNSELKTQLCPYAHDILKDFRIIYKYTDEDICKFMILLQDSNLFSFKNYLNYIPMSLKPEFNIDTFKVHKCQLDEACPNDYHICPYYHKSEKVDEQRRPPTLFGYMGSAGDLCFNQRKKVYCPDKCPCGIFCRFVHSKNEFNYHQDHFRKEFDCKREKNKYGKCIYINTCYGKHPKEEYNKINIKEEEEKIDSNEIENDEDINNAKEKINKIFNIAKAFRCRKCQNIESNLCYFTQCKHFVCVKCYKKMYKDNKKINSDKKEKNEKKNLKCPFCDKEITKDNAVKVEF